MRALPSGMLVRRLLGPIFVVLALSFCQGRAVCSAVIGNNNVSVFESASQACAPQRQGARVWDVPLPTLHEKIYGRRHDEQQSQITRSGSIAPLPFAYITASSWPRWGTRDTGCESTAPQASAALISPITSYTTHSIFVLLQVSKSGIHARAAPGCTRRCIVYIRSQH
jgi:hypothetical protein